MRFYNISSEWGLIALAIVFGVIGVLAVRRRQQVS
jgi:hypothetical protein